MHTIGIRGLLALGMVLLAAGCSNFLRSDVVGFYEGSLPEGETIRIIAQDPDKARSLEFRNYSRLVGTELAKLGYTYVEEPEGQATLLAELDYSVEAGQPDLRLERRLSPFVRYHFYYGRFYDPFYFGIRNSWDDQVLSSPNYVRNLTMNIVRNDEAAERLFEGRVRSVGRQQDLPSIMPYLVTALFTNFPGENGVTKMVTIEMDE